MTGGPGNVGELRTRPHRALVEVLPLPSYEEKEEQFKQQAMVDYLVESLQKDNSVTQNQSSPKKQSTVALHLPHRNGHGGSSSLLFHYSSTFSASFDRYPCLFSPLALLLLLRFRKPENKVTEEQNKAFFAFLPGQSKGTPPAGLKSKSKSKSNTIPIPIVRGNKLDKLVKMTLMVTTLQTLLRETSTKSANSWKGNYQNRDKKDNDSTSKEAHALERYIKYSPIGIMCTQALERLLSKGTINFPLIRPDMETTWKPKNWDLNKYCTYH
ncbi:hypothetical protein Cgig2_030576 [Carnegiea gigantea]|uniref:Uncharacterized protein n=1 Tax=Carnegiea gigantea TaxID=171969 RepID=A0A9Q1GLF3_9CARY|nr:hypothetical protein Cgig2_030576 [Carnegiea gigantea]